jgi:hypothetical protein
MKEKSTEHLRVRISKSHLKMVQELKEKCSVNMSQLVRNLIEREYEKMLIMLNRRAGMEKWWEVINEYEIGKVKVKEIEWPQDRLVIVNKEATGRCFVVSRRNNTVDQIVEGELVLVPTFNLEECGNDLDDLISRVVDCSDDISHVGVFRVKESQNIIGIIGMNADFEIPKEVHSRQRRNIL